MSSQKISFTVGGVQGEHCLKRIQNTLSDLEGISNVSINKDSNQVSVTYNSDQIQGGYIGETLESLGYSIHK